MLDLLFPAPALPQLHSDPIIEGQQALRHRELQYIDVIYAGCPYDYPEIKEAIHLFKYRRMPSLSAHLSRLIIDAKFDANSEVLCPVPLHWTRQFWRGFNQAEMIAKEVSAAYNISMLSLLTRVRPTGHQAHRKRNERLLAMQNAFVCNAKSVPKKIILIDDLATTGATLDACAKALKKVGVQRVEGWVVAHG